MIAKQTVYLDENRKAVLEGPAARILLVYKGQEIADKSFQDIPGAAALISSEATKAAPKKGDSSKDLEERTVPQLRELAAARNINVAGLKKQEIIDLLQGE